MDPDALKRDNVSGASEILRDAGRALLEHLDSGTPQSLQRFGLELIRSQPRMAPLFNLVNAALLASGDAASEVRVFLEQHERAENAVLAQAEPLILDAQCIGIYSRSSTVIRALLRARQRGGRFRIFVTESRPMREGNRAAEELARAGVAVTLAVDAAMRQLVNDSDLILLGADAISATSWTNKIGSAALASLARAAASPLWILTTTQKFIPDRIRLPGEADHARDEVWPQAPDNIKVANRYFESVSIRAASGVIAETGVLDPAALHRLENEVEIATPLLREFSS